MIWTYVPDGTVTGPFNPCIVSLGSRGFFGHLQVLQIEAAWASGGRPCGLHGLPILVGLWWAYFRHCLCLHGRGPQCSWCGLSSGCQVWYGGPSGGIVQVCWCAFCTMSRSLSRRVVRKAQQLCRPWFLLTDGRCVGSVLCFSISQVLGWPYLFMSWLLGLLSHLQI